MAADCSQLAATVYEQLKHYARQDNVTNFDDAVKEMERDFPDLTREQISRFIVEASTGKAREIPEWRKKLNKMKSEAKKETRLAEAISNLENILAKQETLADKESPQTDPSDTVRELQEAHRRLLNEYNESSPAIKKKLQKQIEKLGTKIAEDSFVLPINSKKLPADNELRKLMLQKKELQELGRRKLQNLKDHNSPFKASVRDIYNTTRAIRSSFDASFLFRQGMFVAMSRPGVFFRAWGPALKAAFNAEAAAEIQEDLINSERAVDFMSYRGRLGTDFDVAEEAFGSRVGSVLMDYMKKMPGYDMAADTTFGQVAARFAGWGKKGVQGSERAHRTFVNKIRVDMYSDMVDAYGVGGEVTQEEGEIIANFVNVATGFGDLEVLGSSMDSLQKVFWSPRYQLSRLQMLTLTPLWTAPKSGEKTNLGLGLQIDSNRNIVAQELARMAMGAMSAGSLLVLAAKGYNGDEEEEFSLDPQASDFWTVRIGNTKFDMSGGMRTWAVVAGRLLTGVLQTGEDVEYDIIGEDAHLATGTSVATSFARGKLAPLSSVALDAVVGQPFDDNRRPGPAKIFTDLAVPLPAEVFVKELQKGGVGKAAAKTIADAVGLQSIN